MVADDHNGRMEELRAAAALARERFTALQRAFNAVERAHGRGDYSPSPEFRQRLDEFHQIASRVHRLATELRRASDNQADVDRIK